jgi:hypothetical protein
MKADSLKRQFFTSAATGFLFDHSEKIATGCFVVGHLGLITQAGLSPDITSAAGAFFIMADLVLTRAKKNPVAAFRLCSALGVAGALCLSAGGVDFQYMQVDNGWRVASALMALPTLAIVGLQNEIGGRAEKHLKSGKGNGLTRAFAAACRYPLLLSAAIGAIGGAGLVVSALVDRDLSFMAVLGLWGVGGCGMVLSDPRMQHSFHSERNRYLGGGKPPGSPSPSALLRG